MKVKYLVPAAGLSVAVAFLGTSVVGARNSGPPPVRAVPVAEPSGPPVVADDVALDAQVRHEFDTGWMQVVTPNPGEVGFVRLDELMPGPSGDGMQPGEAVRIYRSDLEVVGYFLPWSEPVPAEVFEQPGFDWVEWVKASQRGDEALAQIERSHGPQEGGTPTVIGELFEG